MLDAYSKESFRKRHFTEEEQQLIARKEARAATTFAAKEAVVKAMGTGFTGISLTFLTIMLQKSRLRLLIQMLQAVPLQVPDSWKPLPGIWRIVFSK